MSDDRGVSTVLDVALCLLLVGASVGVLASAQPTAPAAPDGPSVARETATALAGATATVTYDRATGATHRAHGTQLGLLATAARVRTAGGPVRFVDAVRARLAATVQNVSAPVQVVAQTAGGGGGRLAVGETPPEGATVTAVRVPVPVNGGWAAGSPHGRPAEGTATVVVRSWSP